MTFRRLAMLGVLLTASWTSPAAAQGQGAPNPLYERMLMEAAGARCKLFPPETLAALSSARRQARGAALRAGADPAVLDAVEGRARGRAAAIPCASPDLAVAATRVKAAFAGWTRLRTMSFPGLYAPWRADRDGGRAGTPGWRLSQSAAASAGPALLGILGDGRGGEGVAAVAAWPGALAAATARLVVRDPAMAAAPYLDPRRKALAAQTPPRAAARVFLASGREAAAPPLVPVGATSGAVFRFPAAAAAAIEALDPREAVVLELVYATRNGERVEDVPFEVGDFAAARAFLAGAR